jgi:hypothetical protein
VRNEPQHKRSLECWASLLLCPTYELRADFSFDYDGIHAMENSVAANKLGWNTRNVNVKNYSGINASRFQMVTLNNDDPNGLLH